MSFPRTPDTHATASPFYLWPTGLGFGYFYGFVGGDTNQWRPTLYGGTSPATPHHMDTTLDHCLARDLIHWLHGCARQSG